MRQRLDSAGCDRSTSAQGGRAAGARAIHPQQEILRLQRSAGNRAVSGLLTETPAPLAHPTRMLQRGKGAVNIVDPAKKSGWPWKNEYEKWMADYLVIQECMINPTLYRPALAALGEAVMKERKSGEAATDDAPLDRALLAMETKYGINLQGAPIYTRTLSSEVFGEMSKQSVVATDPGAGAAHGAYTHRIQWWVVLSNAAKLTHLPADLVKNAINPDYKPPEKNWPQQSEVKGLGTQPVPENRGTLWDALFDRTVPQMFEALHNIGELGISHPELFTTEIRKSSFPELGNVAQIIDAQVKRNWGGGGGASDAAKTESDLPSTTYKQYKEGVYFRVPSQESGETKTGVASVLT